MDRLKKILIELINLNFDYVLNAISWRLPNWLFRYMTTVLVRSDSPKYITRELTSYTEKFAESDDAYLFKKINIKPELVKERLENGDKCYIICQNDDILTIIWSSPEKRYLKLGGAILDPGDDGVIVYGGYTNESVRLRGLFPVAFDKLYQSNISDNKPVIYAAIGTLNKNSLKLHKRMNFIEVGKTIHFAIFNIKITYYKHWPHKTRKIHIFIKTPPENLYWN